MIEANNDALVVRDDEILVGTFVCKISKPVEPRRKITKIHQISHPQTKEHTQNLQRWNKTDSQFQQQEPKTWITNQELAHAAIVYQTTTGIIKGLQVGKVGGYPRIGDKRLYSLDYEPKKHRIVFITEL